MLEGFVKFCRLQLGMKPFIDYAQSRSRLLGVRDLPIRTVFDVGANVGKMSRLYRRMFPEAMIYSFEPAPGPFQKLTEWAKTQDGKVKTFNIALGKAPGTATMYWNLKYSGGSSLVQPKNPAQGQLSEVKVTVETLSRMAAQLEVRDEILVKIDVEGLDLEVIQGGTELLRRASAVIVEIPLLDAPAEFPSFGAYVKALDDLGFMYRGNLACAYVSGIALLADAVFIKQPALRAKPISVAPATANPMQNHR
jgi:FkbM family methyltransferase